MGIVRTHVTRTLVDQMKRRYSATSHGMDASSWCRLRGLRETTAWRDPVARARPPLLPPFQPHAPPPSGSSHLNVQGHVGAVAAVFGDGGAGPGGLDGDGHLLGERRGDEQDRGEEGGEARQHGDGDGEVLVLVMRRMAL